MRSRRKPRYLLVTDLPCPEELSRLPMRTADQYLEGEGDTLDDGLTVVNLCGSYQYLSKGYYVSLLAEARHQRILPTVATIAAISDPFVYVRALQEAGLDTVDFKSARGPRVAGPCRETLSVLGRTLAEDCRRSTSGVFKVYPFPLLRICQFHDAEQKRWQLGRIAPVSLDELRPEELALLASELGKERALKRSGNGTPRSYRIACLWDPRDPYAPSDELTLEKFERAAARQGAILEIIGPDELQALAGYDALFIRTVTGVEHYSFTFAQAAESIDIPVIDDPRSIMRCSNKVFLHELFQKNGLPTPPTAIVTPKTAREEVVLMGFPVIVKLPDGTFSHAVKKAADAAEFEAITREMFQKSPLLIVQAFTPTPFDWRIGVLDGQFLFCAKYHMAKDHWQIVGRFKTGRARYGKVEAVPMDAVPEPARRLALEAAQLVGDGLYGVDIKDTPAGPVVIEVNDNPNVLETDEDAVERDRIYDAIILALIRRVREAAGAKSELGTRKWEV
jgi:glutathione synthase/RimK-type ligase-like ATP-grasp enzyme